MKTKSVTIPMCRGRAVTLSLWQDLGMMKINSVNVLIGFELSKNYRLNAMERVDTALVIIGPVGLTYSKMYWREDDD